MKLTHSVALAVTLGLFASGATLADDEGVERIYYIAADEVEWNYAPTGYSAMTGQPITKELPLWAQGRPYLLGIKFKKAVYQEYTDATFSVLKSRVAEWEHLGILGPLIRAEVGDTIKVVFRNNASFPASVHPHGVFYQKNSEGALYKDKTDGTDKEDDGVPSGGTYIYTWEVPTRAGPSPGGPSSNFWTYHSHTDERRDVNSGLIGGMIITAKGMARDDLTPKDIDREFVVGFLTIIETQSWYIDENFETHLAEPDKVLPNRLPDGTYRLLTPVGQDLVVRNSMNGYLFGNMAPMTMKNGDRVRWYIMAGTNFEVHTPHWHGNTVTTAGRNTDVLELVTMGMQIADMLADNPGLWLFHCHVAGHMQQGMLAMYEVLP